MKKIQYDPLDPIYHDNRSIDIFNKHRLLIKDDEIYQKNINSIEQQEYVYSLEKFNI